MDSNMITDEELNNFIAINSLLSEEKLKGLPTHRLLAYYKKKRQSLLTFNDRDWNDEGRHGYAIAEMYAKIITDELATREHIV